MRLLREMTTLAHGNSYWKAMLTTGRTLSQLDTVTDMRQARTRNIEWLEDLAGSGDLGKVCRVSLCTPQGDVTFAVRRPYTAFQFNVGVMSTLGRTQTAQIVGCITGSEGECIAAIWDHVEQRLYSEFHTNVLRFAAWRPGVFAQGRLNIEALGLRL